MTVDPQKYLRRTYDNYGYPLTQIYFFYVLEMNHMRSARIQDTHYVAVGRSAQALKAFVRSERVDPYVEPRDDHRQTFLLGGHWGKSFRKGGPLEWFNPGRIVLVERDSHGHDKFGYILRNIGPDQIQIGQRYKVFLMRGIENGTRQGKQEEEQGQAAREEEGAPRSEPGEVPSTSS